MDKQENKMDNAVVEQTNDSSSLNKRTNQSKSTELETNNVEKSKKTKTIGLQRTVGLSAGISIIIGNMIGMKKGKILKNF